jgi:hypothetical protein
MYGWKSDCSTWWSRCPWAWNAVFPNADPGMVFTDLELRILERLAVDKPNDYSQPHTLSHCLIKLALLCGYL